MEELSPNPPKSSKKQAAKMRSAKKDRADIAERMLKMVRSKRSSRREALLAAAIYLSLKGKKIVNLNVIKNLAEGVTNPEPETDDLFGDK